MASKKNRRIIKKKPRRFARIRFRRIALVIAVLVVLSTSVFSLYVALDRPITSVRVDGAFKRISPVQIEAAIADHLHGGFMSVRVEQLRAGLETHPWIDIARVRRVWPDSLHLVIVEQVPAARWGGNGLLNMRGELFVRNVRHMPPELPALSGPAGSEIEVARRYLAVRGQLLDAGLGLKALQLDPRGSWELELGNGIAVRLGRRDVDRRLARLIDVVTIVVSNRINDVDYIDLRYSNGFAVGWKRSSLAADTLKGQEVYV